MGSRITEDEINAALARGTVEALAPLVRCLAELTGELESQVEDLQGELETLKEENAHYEGAQVEALTAVRDWMHDVLYLGKPMRDPRRILRIVEDVL